MSSGRIVLEDVRLRKVVGLLVPREKKNDDHVSHSIRKNNNPDQNRSGRGLRFRLFRTRR